MTDWDGCRYEVEHEVTGFLVPTWGVREATRNGTSRYLLGETSYAEFLAETNQTIGVDVGATTMAFTRLLTDSALRAGMGAAGRRRVLDRFTWERVVRRYAAVWEEQERVRAEAAAPVTAARTPLPFPDIEHSFASYPATFLDGTDRVCTSADAHERLGDLLALPLTNYRSRTRVTAPAPLAHLLDRAADGCALADLDEALPGHDPEVVRATIAWMLKYDLLRRVP